MHPAIAELISRAYYADQGGIKSATVDDQGHPLPKVRHPFILPHDIKDKAILWLDVPWVGNGGRGEETGDGKYTSPDELHVIIALLKRLQPRDDHRETVDVAVLSPYRRQVMALSSELRSLYRGPEKPTWLAPLEDWKLPANTVDSFQGNEAKVVIVSLVRNNAGDLEQPLGFLEEATRMNVLFSRAEQLLVLVGSWDFFQNQLGHIDPGHADLGHWRIAIDYLTECFGNGTALRMKASDL
jgi:hypothetical protein